MSQNVNVADTRNESVDIKEYIQYSSSRKWLVLILLSPQHGGHDRVSVHGANRFTRPMANCS